MIEVYRHASARDFLDRAGPWLLGAEAENGLILGLARQVAHDRARCAEPLYFATLERRGRLVGCAFRTPPHPVGLTVLPRDAVPALIADLRSLYDKLPGVGGPVDVAAEFASRWTALAGGRWKIRFRQRIHVLTSVRFPDERAPGRLRLAAATDIRLADAWAESFVREIGVPFPAADFGSRLVREKRLYFWDVGGPRCMLANVRETQNGSSINAVYTPPEYRRRGYATMAVASLSQQLLDSGRTFCSLYTDLANPTSNGIYGRIGYRGVTDVLDIAFG